MADIKWSQFGSGGDNVLGDETVGLRSGVNLRFNAPNLQSVYNVSPTPKITDISAHPLFFQGNDVFFQGTDGSTTDIDGGFLQFNNPNDVGVLNNAFYIKCFGTTPNADNIEFLQISSGFVNETAGQEASFLTFGISDGNGFNSLFSLIGNSGNGTRVVFGGTDSVNSHIEHFSINVGFSGTERSNGLFQINSTTKGVLPFPRLTNAQVGVLQALLSSGDQGMFYYNTDFNVLDYFDGTSTQDLLAIDKIIQGANMTVTNNGDGTVTLASSGSTPSATAIQGSFTSNTVATNTPVTPTSGDVAIAVESGGFSVVHTVGANVQLATIGGVQTAVIQNTSVGGRWCSINFDLTMLISTSAGGTYTFTIYTNTGALINFRRVTVPTTTPSYVELSICSPMVFLNTSDYVYLAVSGTSVPAVSNFIATYFNGRLIDTTINSLPNTDSLAQGTANLYLSQDGGSHYQNVASLPVVVGNFAMFNTVGGELADSGIPVSTFFSGIYVPTLTVTSGISGSISNVSSKFMRVGNIVIVSQYISFTANNSLIEFTTSLPVSSTFSTSSNAFLSGQTFTTDPSPAIGDGQIISANSISSSSLVGFTCISAVGSGTKVLQYSFVYEVI